MKNKILTQLIFLTFLLFSNYSNSQAFDKTKELTRLANIPGSPEAKAFSSYGNVDVGLYTGTPNINVPIYVHQGRELNLPINLSYDASGIKVEQEATGVGLGWNLNVGGRISRLTNGLPDDYELGDNGTSIPYKSHWDDEVRNGIQNYIDNQYSFETKDQALAYLDFLRRLNDNEYDALPDYFSFNALGINDMFVIDVNERKAIALNNPRIKVNCHKTAGNSSILQWTVTLDDGTVLKFNNNTEVTRSVRDNDVSDVALNAFKLKYNSSWLLTDIISPTGKDRYKFVYQKFPEIQINANKDLITAVVNYTQNPNPGAFGNPNFTSLPKEAGRNHAQIFREELQLTKILYKSDNAIGYNQIVKFNLKARTDHDNPNAIDKIEIFNTNQDRIKTYKFNHSYFGTRALKFDSIDILDSNNTFVSNYQFDYVSGDLPPNNSFSQDYYGYYNGKSNSVLYPRTNQSEYINDGADRSVSFTHAQRGTLNKIVYPTGGHTLFNYGPHKSSQANPTQIESTTTFEGLANLNLQGGQVCDQDWDFNCPESECQTQDCIGSYSEIGSFRPPNYKHVVFYVSESGGYKYSTSQTVNNSTVSGAIPLQRVILFKRTDINTANPNLSPSPYRVDEIFRFSIPDNDDPIVQMANDYSYLSNSSDSYNHHDQDIGLDQGYYQLTIVNPQEGSNTNFTIGKYETINNSGSQRQIAKAGLRVEFIEDYSKDGILALRKEYDYSNGTVISEPFYEHLVTNYTVEDYWGNEENNVPPMLYRYTHASGTDKPHIGYSKVIEKVVDFNNPENEIKTKNEFNTATWGNHRTGVYTYYINGKETAKNYGVIYSLGKPKKVVSDGNYNANNLPIEGYGEKYINTYEYGSKDYYVNRGVYTKVIENRSHLYSCPEQTPNGTWFIDFKAPQIDPSLDSSVLLPHITGGSSGVSHASPIVFSEDGNSSNPDSSGSQTLYYSPPDRCLELEVPSELCSTALGRLDLQIASAYGRIGYLTKSKAYERQGSILQNEEVSLEDISIIQEETNTYYDNADEGPLNYLLKSKTTTKSNGSVVSQEFLYPDNFSADYNNPQETDEYYRLVDDNMLNTPVQVNVSEGESDNLNLISRKKTEYNSSSLPSKILIAKDNDEFENRIQFEQYKNKNIVQIRETNGSPTAYIWGYDNQYIVAKIQNATYASIENLAVFGSNFTINQELNQNQENALRVLPNVIVTTYTYKPMVGVTSITDSKGQSIYYEYDENNRLKHVKDNDGNILSKSEYNYRSQN